MQLPTEELEQTDSGCIQSAMFLLWFGVSSFGQQWVALFILEVTALHLRAFSHLQRMYNGFNRFRLVLNAFIFKLSWRSLHCTCGPFLIELKARRG